MANNGDTIKDLRWLKLCEEAKKMSQKSIQIIRILLIMLAITSVALYCKINIPKLQESKFDDAFMFLRYAKHWLSQSVFSWNIDDGSVYGVTSLAHLINITALRGLTNLPDTLVITVTSFTAGIGTLCLLTAICFIFFKKLRNRCEPLLIVPIMVLSPLFSFHSCSGMETTTALFSNSMLVAAILYYRNNLSKISIILCLATGYLSFLVRPDSGIYSLLLPPLIMLSENHNNWKNPLKYIIGFVMVLIVDLFIKNKMLGGFVPLSFYAKSSGFYLGFLNANDWNAGHEAYIFLRDALPFLVIIILFAKKSAKFLLISISLPILLTFLYLGSVIQIMGSNARYYYPTLPFIVMASFIAINSSIVEENKIKKCAVSPERIILSLILMCLLLSPTVESTISYIWNKYFIATKTTFVAQTNYKIKAANQLPKLEWWIAITEMNNLLIKLPSNIVFAASEYGYIGSQHPEMKIIDLIGLHNKHMRNEGFNPEKIICQYPDLIWMPNFGYSYAFAEILDNSTFQRQYTYFPNAYVYGIGILKTSSHYSEILDQVSNEFVRIYGIQKIDDYVAVPTRKCF